MVKGIHSRRRTTVAVVRGPAQQKWCQWCRSFRNGRGFGTHESACRKRYEAPTEPSKNTELYEPPRKKRKLVNDMVRGHPGRYANVLTSRQMDHELSPPPSPSAKHMLDNPEQQDASGSQVLDREGVYIQHGLQRPFSPLADTPQDVPRAYIKIVYHPHSGRQPLIVPLDGNTPAQTTNTAKDAPQSGDRPWAPFRSRADFEFAESAVNEKMSHHAVDVHLQGMHGSWSRSGSNISFRNYDDLRRSLDAARDLITDVCLFFLSKLSSQSLQFQEGSVTARFDGKDISHHFWFRDVWEWTKRSAADSELSKTHQWHSCKKYYCEGEYTERIIDDMSTADEWWDEEVSMFYPAKPSNLCRSLLYLRQTHAILCPTVSCRSLCGWTRAR